MTAAEVEKEVAKMLLEGIYSTFIKYVIFALVFLIVFLLIRKICRRIKNRIVKPNIRRNP